MSLESALLSAHFSDYAATEAVCRVIVDDAGRLHPRIDDDGTYEFESSLLQHFGYLLREWSLSRYLTGILNRLSADEVPDEGREIIPRNPHRKISASATDCPLDLSPRSDDTRVFKKPRHIRFAKTRYQFWIEVLERLANRFALVMDDGPGQACLESFEHKRLPELLAVVFWHAPFLIRGTQGGADLPPPRNNGVPTSTDGFSSSHLSGIRYTAKKRITKGSKPHNFEAHGDDASRRAQSLRLLLEVQRHSG